MKKKKSRLTVLGESDDLQHPADFGKDLEKRDAKKYEHVNQRATDAEGNNKKQTGNWKPGRPMVDAVKENESRPDGGRIKFSDA